MPRDAKRMKPMRGWAIVKPDGTSFTHTLGHKRYLNHLRPMGRIARVEIRELPAKRKPYAP